MNKHEKLDIKLYNELISTHLAVFVSNPKNLIQLKLIKWCLYEQKRIIDRKPIYWEEAFGKCLKNCCAFKNNKK